MVEFKTSSAKETENLGLELAKFFRHGSGLFSSSLRSSEEKMDWQDGAFVIALNGELGSGKTTLIKGIAKGLGLKETITSPTYVFVRSYSFEPIIRHGFRKDTLYHLDLYRMDYQDKKTLQSFGFDEITRDPKGIVVIEWAERLGGTARLLSYLSFNFHYNNKRERLITGQINK